MTDAPRLSVIIPIYNAAPYLRECLANLSGCYEVICVNDGSTDESAAILSEYPWLRVLHRENGGPSAARNDGLAVATGDYVMFLDADDVMMPQFLDVFQRAIAHWSDVDIIQFEYVGYTFYRRAAELNAKQRKDYLKRALTIDRFGVVTGKFFRRSLLKGLAFDPRLIGGEDTLLAVQAIKRARRIIVLPDALYFNRVVANSLSHRHFPESVPISERMLTLLRAETGATLSYYMHAVGKFNWCVAVSGCSRRELAARPIFAEALRKTRVRRAWRWMAAVPWRAKRKLKKVLLDEEDMH